MFYESEECEIKTEITNLPKNKSTGIDNFKADTLKQIIEYEVTPFIYVLNQCVKDDFYLFKNNNTDSLHFYSRKKKII